MTRYKINKGFIAQDINATLTIYDTEQAVMYTFNETAKVIFKKLKAGKRLIDIAKHLHVIYDISMEDAEKDITQFVLELKRKKIISAY